MLICDSFHNLSGRKVDRLCLVSGETRLTYREFNEQVTQLAAR